MIQEKCSSLVLGILLITTTLYQVSANKDSKGCTHEGRDYNDGENRQDDCNTCICAGNTWACTLKSCDYLSTCEHNGKWWKHEATRKSDDGCNTCTCFKRSWSCTEMACIPTTDATAAIKSEDGCVDYDGKKRAEGEQWGCLIGNMRSCSCNKGQVACATPSCMGPPTCVKFDHSQCCPTCIEEKPNCERACPRNLDERCGSDGKVYANVCLLDIAKCKDDELDEIPCSIKRSGAPSTEDGDSTEDDTSTDEGAPPGAPGGAPPGAPSPPGVPAPPETIL